MLLGDCLWRFPLHVDILRCDYKKHNEHQKSHKANALGDTYYREQKRNTELQYVKLCLVTPVTGPPGRVPRQKD